jgi:hypothetical protein
MLSQDAHQRGTNNVNASETVGNNIPKHTVAHALYPIQRLETAEEKKKSQEGYILGGGVKGTGWCAINREVLANSLPTSGISLRRVKFLAGNGDCGRRHKVVKL